jgi:polygalacturonase
MRRFIFLALIAIVLMGATKVWATTVSQNLSITVTSSGSSDPTSGLLPSVDDAYANWTKAGLQTVGGIPNRTAQCGSTISPLGSGQNDTSQIQTAINNCPAGDVVQLAAGTFTISEGSFILINKGITLRGAGAGQTILTRTGGATLVH